MSKIYYISPAKKTTWMKKILFLAFMGSLAVAGAQVEPVLPAAFDKGAVILEARKKGIPDSDIEGYVRAAYARYRNENEPRTQKITVVDLQNNKMYTTIQTTQCQNSDFSMNDYSNWTGDISDNCSAGSVYPAATYSTTGFNGNNGSPIVSNTDPCNASTVSTDRHVIMSMPIGAVQNNNTQAFLNGYDPSCCNINTQMYDLPMRPNNTTNAIRLGSAYANETSEKLIYPLTVTSSNAQFTYQFAVVVNDGGHPVGEQPAFRFAMKDNTGNVLTQGGSAACMQYDKDATGAQTDSTYIQNYSNNPCWNSGGMSTWYRPWATVTVDLTAYIGQTVYAEFETLDCPWSGHFCYAYISATCGALQASVGGMCGGVNVATLFAPQGFANYQWYGPNNLTPISGATNTTYTANPATNGDVYTVDCITLQGCTTRMQVTVAPTNILASVTSNNTCQGGTSGSASVTVSGGTQYSYTWSPSGSNASSISNLPPGSYSVTVHDNTNNCPDTTMVVNISAAPPTLQTTTDTLCSGYVVLDAPQPGTNYQWYGPSGSTPISGATSPNYTVTSGTGGQYYTVSYMNTTTNCRDSIRTTLNQINLQFSNVPSAPCNSGTNGSITIIGQAGNTYPTYNWSMTGSAGAPQSGTNVPMPQTSILIDSLPQGTFTVVVYPTADPGCAYTLTVTLTEGQVPAPTLDTLLGCAAEALTIPTATVSGNTHNWWTSSGTFVGNSYPYVTPGVSNGEVYTDSIYNSSGCLSIYKAYLKEQSFKISITAPEKVRCYNDSTGKLRVTVTQEVNGPLGTSYTFNWDYPSPHTDPAPVNAGVGVPQTSQMNNLHPGTYTCVVTSGACVATATYVMTNPALLLNDSLYANYCPKDSLLWLYAEPGHSSYNWVYNGTPVSGYNNDSIQIVTQNINAYQVWYTESGCRDTARILITGPSYNAFRPDLAVTIFTPNDDKTNDYFYPFYDPNLTQYQIDKQVEEYSVVVYNRWGKKVFESEQYTKPWDGKVNGEPQSAGTYFYLVRYKSNCSTKADVIEKHGYVQLLR